MDHLHGEHLAVRFVLCPGYLILSILLELLDFVSISFGQRNLFVVAFLDGGGLHLHIRLDYRGYLREDSRHSRHDHTERVGHGFPAVALQPLGQLGVGFLHGIETLLRSLFEILLFQCLFGDGRGFDDFLPFSLVVSGRVEHLLRQGIQRIDLQPILLLPLFGRHKGYPFEILLIKSLLPVLRLLEFGQLVGLQFVGNLFFNLGALLATLGIQLFEPVEICYLRLEFHSLVSLFRNSASHITVGIGSIAFPAFGFYLLSCGIELLFIPLCHLLFSEFVELADDIGYLLFRGLCVLQLFEKILFIELCFFLDIFVVIHQSGSIAGESLRLLDRQPVVFCLKLISFPAFPCTTGSRNRTHISTVSLPGEYIGQRYTVLLGQFLIGRLQLSQLVVRFGIRFPRCFRRLPFIVGSGSRFPYHDIRQKRRLILRITAAHGRRAYVVSIDIFLPPLLRPVIGYVRIDSVFLQLRHGLFYLDDLLGIPLYQIGRGLRLRIFQNRIGQFIVFGFGVSQHDLFGRHFGKIIGIERLQPAGCLDSFFLRSGFVDGCPIQCLQTCEFLLRCRGGSFRDIGDAFLVFPLGFGGLGRRLTSRFHLFPIGKQGCDSGRQGSYQYPDRRHFGRTIEGLHHDIGFADLTF